MPEFGTYPLGQQFRYRRGNESFTTMTAAIKTWGAHTEPPKHRIETAAPIILQVAPTMTAWTRPHSFAVPLQLFADHNLWQPSENWLGVRELLTQPHTQVHPRDLRSVTCWAFASHRVGRHFYPSSPRTKRRREPRSLSAAQPLNSTGSIKLSSLRTNTQEFGIHLQNVASGLVSVHQNTGFYWIALGLPLASPALRSSLSRISQ
jgi:hypothetical protein